MLLQYKIYSLDNKLLHKYLYFYNKYVHLYLKKIKKILSIITLCPKFKNSDFTLNWVALPAKQKKITVLRAPHIDKKSKENFLWKVTSFLLTIKFRFNLPVFLANLVSLEVSYSFLFLLSNGFFLNRKINIMRVISLK